MTEARRWDLLNTLFLTGTLALALMLVPWRLATVGLRWSEALVFLAMTFTIGTAITAGYHRLFSHRAYKATWPVRFVFLCLGAAAFENSALKWSSDHRIHHQHVDTEQDPYSIRHGFWYAHWTWVMESRDLPIAGVTDLEKDPLVRWQHRNHFLIGAVVATLPLWIGLATGNLLGHLVFGVVLRIVTTHHTTFLINSAPTSSAVAPTPMPTRPATTGCWPRSPMARGSTISITSGNGTTGMAPSGTSGTPPSGS